MEMYYLYVKETWKFLLTEGISVYFLVFIFKHQSWVQLSECIYPDCIFVKMVEQF